MKKVWFCMAVLSLIIGILMSIPKTTKYIFSPQQTESKFDCTPEEFCSTRGGSTIWYGHFTSSKVDKSGNLLIFMTKEQRESLFRDKWGYQITQHKEEGIIYAPDYKSVSVDFNKRTIDSDVFNLLFAIQCCSDYQLLINETQDNDIVVHANIIDSESGEKLFNDDYNFSTVVEYDGFKNQINLVNSKNREILQTINLDSLS